MAMILRPATPADSDFLGWVCVMAARSHLPRGWFDIVLQRDDAFVFEFASRLTVTTVVSWWHWSLFAVAEIDGKPAAAMCGFADSRVYETSGAAMAEVAAQMDVPRDEVRQYWPRGKFVMSCLSGEDGAWTIENVAAGPNSAARVPCRRSSQTRSRRPVLRDAAGPRSAI